MYMTEQNNSSDISLFSIQQRIHKITSYIRLHCDRIILACSTGGHFPPLEHWKNINSFLGYGASSGTMNL